jgi:YD repeat-containing protein
VTLNPSVQLGNRTFLKIIDGTGNASYFIQEVPGYYSGVIGERSYVRAEGGGYGWYRLDGTRYVFTSTGKLSTVEDEKGNVLALAYDGQGRLQTVTDNASGRVLTFTYTNGLLASISGPVTSAVTDAIWVEYGYDGNENLTTVTYADGSGIAYVYNDIHNLTQKKDSLNHILREWSYSTNDQATVCRSPDGKGVELVTYQTNQVQVKDVYDITRTYVLVTVDGVKRLGSMTGVTNAPYAESNAVEWVYDEWGRLSEVEYGGGRIDLYQNYDERGNPGTVILAYGSAEERTLYYTYHPEMNVPLTRTEASVFGGGNKVTTWDYDNDYDTIPNENPTGLLSRIIEQGYTKDINNTTQAYEYVTIFTYNAKG